MVAKVLSVISLVASIVLSFSLHSPPKIPVSLNPLSCPPPFKKHPVILVSMDGFRADYLSRGFTPTLIALANRGVRAPYMKASYPTITFPNHYTIATGLYPPVHGIIANKFYDPEFKAEFQADQNESLKVRWWGGEPIWKTVEKQGKRAATYFWPGSEVEGNRPSYWFPYNESVPFEVRVDQVLAWLDLPPNRRPSFMTLYMHEPDTMGHMFGPNTPQVDGALKRVDSMVKRLVEGIQRRNLLSCVNILLVADHGMAEAGSERVIRLDKYIPYVTQRTRFYSGVFGRMTPKDSSEATKKQILDALSCKRPELRVYEKSALPVRWHVGTQRRVEDIVVDLDAGYTVAGDNTFKPDAGDHGYDNFFSVMNAMFVAHGPAFHRNTEIEAFQNIELYNLMCQLLGLYPAPNNGTWGSLHHILRRPPPPPPTLTGLYDIPPPLAEVPRKENLESRTLTDKGKGDSDDTNVLIEALEEAQEELPELLREHLPWGIPKMGNRRETVVLLPQPNTMTAYSSLIKMPLWTSYSLYGKVSGGGEFRPWQSDSRLKDDMSPSCTSYDYVRSYNISRYPLFPPYFISRDDYAQLPYLTSNAVPFTQQLAKRWEQLITYVKKWAKLYGALNVISGPVFDYDADTFADDMKKYGSHSDLLVPTHMFLVATRCIIWVDDLRDCPHTHLDSLAFVYPQYLAVSNCLSASRFAREFSATVLDVQKITGLEFFPKLRYYDRTRLQVRIHSNIWGRESWWNRIRSDVFGLR